MNKNVSISAEDCVRVNNYLFFISKEINVIFSINMDNGKLNIIDSIPEEEILDSRLGAKIINWNNQLIFAPMSAKKIWRYNIDTKEWKGYERQNLGDGKTGDEMFQAILYHDAIFIIGSNYPAIIRLDLQTDEISYYEEPYNVLKGRREEYRDCYFRSDCAQIDNYIYLATSLDNMVFKFDMEKLEFESFHVGNKDNRYSGIAWDGMNFWLAPRYNTPIVKWNGMDNYKEYILPDVFSKNEANFLGVTCTNDEIIFPGFLSPYTVVISRNRQDKLDIKKERYHFLKKLDGGLIVKFYNNTMEFVYRNGESKKYCIQIDRDILMEYLRGKRANLDNETKTLQEGNIKNLDLFCELLKDKTGENCLSKSNLYGEKIWETIHN